MTSRREKPDIVAVGQPGPLPGLTGQDQAEEIKISEILSGENSTFLGSVALAYIQKRMAPRWGQAGSEMLAAMTASAGSDSPLMDRI